MIAFVLVLPILDEKIVSEVPDPTDIADAVPVTIVEPNTLVLPVPAVVKNVVLVPEVVAKQLTIKYDPAPEVEIGKGVLEYNIATLLEVSEAVEESPELPKEQFCIKHDPDPAKDQ